MKKIAYLECPTGIAGDMCLGALVDVGVPLEYLIEQLRQLNIEQEYRLWAEKVHRNGQAATKVHVDLLKDGEKVDEETTFHRGDRHAHARHLPDIERLIQASDLPQRALQWSLEVFRQLAVAEGAVHGIAPEKVHFHEVGATDAIVDIVGTCLGLDWLGIDELHCSPLPTGGGMVKVAHGRLPVPVPAVLKLWEMRQVPVYSNGIDKELVTPTGAAIATTLATGFGAPPPLTIERIGLGAGTAQLALPNLLRLWLGSVSTSLLQEEVAVLETQIDDASPQAIAYAMEALFQAGALDVFGNAIAMKKSRLGTLLTVICLPEKVAECEAVLFAETTTIGIRHSIQQRSILQREIQPLETAYGTVRIKVASQGEGTQHKVMNVHPEYEDCAQLAKQHQVPWLTVHQTAIETWHSHRAEKVESILNEVVKWARRAGILAVSLVGSWARGAARTDSDIDLIILTSHPSHFRQDETWLALIDWQTVGSPVEDWKDVNYGLAWSRHVYLKDGTEIEFGFGSVEWASLNPIEAGTFRVVSNGCRILYDPEKLMNKLLAKVQSKLNA